MEAVSAPAPPPSVAASPVMGMLHDHVPLTLLLDLAFGVSSSDVYAREVADVSWVPAVVSRAS